MTPIDLLRQAHALYAKGDLSAAAALYRQVLAVQPNHPDALNSLGMIAHRAANPAAAVDLFQRALTQRPQAFDITVNLAIALEALGRREQSVAAYRRAAMLPTSSPEMLCKLAEVFRKLGLYHDALACCRRAADLNPNDTRILYVLAAATYYVGDFAQALALSRKVLELNPNDPNAHYSYGYLLLMHGDFLNGWPEFEYRTKIAGSQFVRQLEKPEWDGSDIPGKTLLIHSEGGFGDSIQFIRYLPQLKGRAARIILECESSLHPLFANIEGIDELAERGKPLPHFDVHLALPSLPRILKTDLSNLPNTVPYLKILDDRKAKFPDLPRSGRLTVGICWAGNRGQPERDCAPTNLSPFGKIDNINWFSLQLGRDDESPPAGLFPNWTNLTPQITDWSDTAALIDRLDLVITVDTSIAHLAGALAKPVWLLTPFVADYRWLLNRTDSPWYPTMQLFRQQAYGDWSAPVAQIAAKLAGLV